MIVEFPKLEKWQADLFDYYLQHKTGKWCIVKSLRQIGKSTVAQLLLMYSALTNDNSVCMCVSPILSQSRKMYEDIVRNFNKLITKNNGSSLEITTINGSKILFKSAEQYDGIRGITIKNGGIVVVDEAAYVKDDVYYSIIVPTTNVYNASIFVFSTPKFKSGFFYDLYTQGLMDDAKVKSFNWCTYDTSKYLGYDTLSIYRERLPKLSFQSEFLGEFIDGEGTVFTDFKQTIKDTTLTPHLPIVIGIDWGTGTGSDYTVLTVAQLVDGVVIITEQIAFNDKNAQQTIDYIKLTVEALKSKINSEITVVVEKNSIGNVYYQLLYEALDEDTQVVLFNTTNKTKDKIIKQLQVLFETNRIIIPNDSKLINELSAYECKINTNGTPTYNAPIGLHDDRVMSLCFCVNQMYNELC